MRNADTGQVATVTVIGVLETKRPSGTVGGIYANDAVYRATFGSPVYQRHYLRLQPGTDAKAAARDIESALALQGVEADSLKKVLDDLSGQQTAFTFRSSVSAFAPRGWARRCRSSRVTEASRSIQPG